MTILNAAEWATLALKDRPALLRMTCSVAGRVMAVENVDEKTCQAGWLYKACESASKQEEMDDLLATIKELFDPKVFSIVKSMVAPISSNQAKLDEIFTQSLPPAKLIRICECIMALDQAATFLLSGSLTKLNEAMLTLNYSIHVYKNSPKANKELRLELRRALVLVKNLCETLRAVSDGIENIVDPSQQVPIRLFAVANELGTIATKQMPVEAEDAAVKAAFMELRQATGGSMFAESMFHLTIPIPKISKALDVSPPDENEF